MHIGKRVIRDGQHRGHMRGCQRRSPGGSGSAPWNHIRRPRHPSLSWSGSGGFPGSTSDSTTRPLLTPPPPPPGGHLGPCPASAAPTPPPSPQGNNEIYYRDPKLETDLRYNNFFLGVSPAPTLPHGVGWGAQSNGPVTPPAQHSLDGNASTASVKGPIVADCRCCRVAVGAHNTPQWPTCRRLGPVSGSEGNHRGSRNDVPRPPQSRVGRGWPILGPALFGGGGQGHGKPAMPSH